jgi:hypothetical protein
LSLRRRGGLRLITKIPKVIFVKKARGRASGVTP